MTKEEEICLAVDAFTPDTLPMARLAVYLREFSLLLGNDAYVHLSKVKAGSANIVAYSEPQATPKIKNRINEVLIGAAPKPAMKAHRAIDDLLAEDNAIGHISIGSTTVIEFPGRRRAAREQIGPVRRNTTIEGQIFSIGGKDDTINVHLRNGDKEYRCEVGVDLARKLLGYFRGGKVRIFGACDWYRIDSHWVPAGTLAASDFVPLDNRDLSDTVNDLRTMFGDVDEAEFMATMSELRHG